MLISAPLLRAARELGWWSLRRRRRFRVTGTSMEPTLSDGAFVLVDDARDPEIGELVLAEHPDHSGLLVVKRLTERLDDGGVVVTSDNPTGSDSRTWGPLPATALRGRVSLILDRPAATTEPPGGGNDEPHPTRRTDVLRWLRR